MVEIEDRGRNYNSWKSYAKALEFELKLLQQLLPSDEVNRCSLAVNKAIENKKLRGTFD